mgnify:CR=1 FL=1
MFETKNKVVDLDINDVLPNRFQPRVKFNEDAIIELAESIKEHGVIQPIVVRPIGDKYEIIAGERRYKASILAGKETIPAIITDLNDKDSAEIALIENVQRKNLTPIEEAVSYKKILDMGLTQEQLALKLGKSQSSIANKMRLLNLSDEVQDALIEEKISERHARSLLKLTNTSMQNEMLNRIINEKLTVRRTDEEIEKMRENGGFEMNSTVNDMGMNNINIDMNNNNKFMNISSGSGVEEVDSKINTGAFLNSNPGFMDVQKIENEARELEIEEEPKKLDINALLQPDKGTFNQPHQEQPKQDDFKSSLLGFFGKKPEDSFQNNNLYNETKEPEPPVYEPLSKENSTFIPLDKFENNNIDNYDLDTKPVSDNDYKPLDLSSFNLKPEYDDSFTKMETSIDEPTKEEIIKPVIEEKIETKEVNQEPEFISSYKPMPEFDFDENAIDLSQLQNISMKTPNINSDDSDSDLLIDIPIKKGLETKLDFSNIDKPVDTISEEKKESIPSPIIISDYEKQYDPIMPSNKVETVSRPSFKDILFSVRQNVEDIEKSGYIVDTDEIDLGSDYRIIITIKKDGN